MYTAVILEDDISISWEYEMILNELNVEVSCIIKTWSEAVPAIRKAKPDVIIIDLVLSNDQMGFEFIAAINNLFIPMIICTGNSDQKNIDRALELGVQAYLTKPLDKTAFVFQVKKALSHSISNSSEHMIITDKGNLLKVPCGKIIKIEVEGNYSFVVMDNNKRFALKQSLSKTLEKLNPSKFIRCHRTSVVNLNFVSEIDLTNNKILLSNGEELMIGSRFKKEVKSVFKNY